MAGWREYQDEVADFFRALDLTATVDESIEGVRTNHDVDVVVRSRHAGIDVVWLVECKDWKARVPKEKVLAFRQIVKDVGADRGFFMAEAGYQSGALEAARFTNVTLTSLAALRLSLADELGLQDLKALLGRVAVCRERYWSIKKQDRIDVGLRHPVGVAGYSGRVVMEAVSFTVKEALLRGFPTVYDRQFAALSAFSDGLPEGRGGEHGRLISTPQELASVLGAELSDLESRLDEAEKVLAADD